jgi:2-polyprenyl-6-methoxyphenol hydroxylase-like FAD-dependent oxidoreductase
VAEVVTRCVAGCGPAGAVLGLLLARAGWTSWCGRSTATSCETSGGTLHPSRLDVLTKLGLAEQVLRGGPTRVSSTSLRTATDHVVLAEFGRLRTRYPFVRFVPQRRLATDDQRRT